MGKTSLANTFAEFLKSPTAEHPKPVLTKGTDLEFTKVMQLYDGLSVNQKKEIEVQVEELPGNGSVKLVKLKMPKKAGIGEHIKKMFSSWISRAPDEKNDIQLKLVDMGGHSATKVLASAVNISNSKKISSQKKYIKMMSR